MIYHADARTEISAEYIEIARQRTRQMGLFACNT